MAVICPAEIIDSQAKYWNCFVTNDSLTTLGMHGYTRGMGKTCLIFCLAGFIGLFTSSSVRSQTNSDGSIVVPIYVTNSANFSPSHYTIYAGIGGGPLLPYLFDTGAPNFFSVYGTDSNTTGTNGSFTFAQAPTYYYQTLSNGISLGTSNNITNITTQSAAYAQVRYIQGTNGDINQQFGTMISNGTYGDFGAGLYGNSALATILTQVPLDSSLKVGYSLNLTSGGQGGALTLGLSASLLAQLSNAPGAIIMALSPSGSNIPTANGGSISGYNKAQVPNVEVSLTNKNNETTTTNVPFVIDTGGGSNAVIYAANLDSFNNATEMSVASTNGQKLYSFSNGVTAWGGSNIVISNTNDGVRLNSGGYFFESNIVTFDLADGIVIINPVPEPSAGVLFLIGGVLLLGYGFFQRGRPIQKGLATPSR